MGEFFFGGEFVNFHFLMNLWNKIERFLKIAYIVPKNSISGRDFHLKLLAVPYLARFSGTGERGKK